MRTTTVRRFAAFTLVELLVSIIVLTLLIVMVVQIINGATQATGSSRKQLDADGQARVVFDRMAIDFDRMFKRKDVDYAFLRYSAGSGQGANDSMFFYSEAPGFFSGTTNQSSVSLVGYRINPNNTFHPGFPVLERMGKALTWDGAPGVAPSPGSPVYLTYPPASLSPAPTPTPWPGSTIAGAWPSVVVDPTQPTGTPDPDFQIISDQVYRLEYCFQLTNGKFSNYTSINAPYTTVGLKDVSAIVVALAVLDPNSQKIVGNTTHLVSALADPSDTDLAGSPPSVLPKLMATTWLSLINGPTGSTLAQAAGIPQDAAAQVRIYQRTFYLNKP